MSRIRGTNTKLELILKDSLEKKQFIYQPKEYGKPDFINYKKMIVVFIDGCFWHKCPKCYAPPKSNKRYWLPKIEKNAERDKKNARKLRRNGFKVIRIWEHEALRNPERPIRKIIKYLDEMKI